MSNSPLKVESFQYLTDLHLKSCRKDFYIFWPCINITIKSLICSDSYDDECEEKWSNKNPARGYLLYSVIYTILHWSKKIKILLESKGGGQRPYILMMWSCMDRSHCKWAYFMRYIVTISWKYIHFRSILSFCDMS